MMLKNNESIEQQGNRLAVAHLNEAFFAPTETFIYNYLSSFRRIFPIGITFHVLQNAQFPYQYPLIQLYEWNFLSQRWRGIRWRLQRLWQSQYNMTFLRRKTFKALQDYHVQALHAHFGYIGCWALPLKRRTGLPLITTFYGLDMSALPTQDMWRDAYVQLFEEGDLFLVEGENMRQHVITLGCPAPKTAIQRIALHLPSYSFRIRERHRNTYVSRILFCGRFVEKKGLLFALEAVKQAHDRFPQLEFRIIGDGELRPQVEHMIDHYQMRSYTKLLGFQSHNSMIAEMNAADILLQPSITARNGDSEGGAPTTILEAQACGLPVIATRHADIPNVVISGESALLAPEGDSEALYKHIMLLLQEPERLAHMGKAGRSFVEQYHKIEKEVQLLEERYYALAAMIQIHIRIDENPCHP